MARMPIRRTVSEDRRRFHPVCDQDRRRKVFPAPCGAPPTPILLHCPSGSLVWGILLHAVCPRPFPATSVTLSMTPDRTPACVSRPAAPRRGDRFPVGGSADQVVGEVRSRRVMIRSRRRGARDHASALPVRTAPARPPGQHSCLADHLLAKLGDSPLVLPRARTVSPPVLGRASAAGPCRCIIAAYSIQQSMLATAEFPPRRPRRAC